MNSLEETLIYISNSLANVEIQVLDTNVNKFNTNEQRRQRLACGAPCPLPGASLVDIVV